MERSSVFQEGVNAGLLGAVGVAVWFLIIDLAAGQPFYTPTMLGEGLLSLLGTPRDNDNAVLYFWVYTLFHVAAFILVGVTAAAIVRWSEREPSVLAGALILFVAVQVLFYGFTAMMSQRELIGSLAWYQVGAANLVAAALMVSYLWKRHPQLGTELKHTLAGGE